MNGYKMDIKAQLETLCTICESINNLFDKYDFDLVQQAFQIVFDMRRRNKTP